MRLRDILETVQPIRPDDPYLGLVRRIEKGDMDVISDIEKLSIEAVQSIASKVANKQVKQRHAMEEIKSITFDNHYSRWQSDQIDRYFPDRKAEKTSVGWEPNTDTGPKVIPMRRPTPELSEGSREWLDGSDTWKGVGARGQNIRDIILGRNDGDGFVTTALDMDLDPDKDNFFTKIKLLRHKIYTIIEMKKDQPGGVEEMCRHWKVTPDELEKFYRLKGQSVIEFSPTREARKLIANGITDNKQMIAILAKMTRERGIEPNLKSIAAHVSSVRKEFGLSTPRPVISPEQRQTIVTMKKAGKGDKETAAAARVSIYAVFSTWKKYKAARDRDRS